MAVTYKQEWTYIFKENIYAIIFLYNDTESYVIETFR